MNIDDTVNQLVKDIVDQITNKVQEQVGREVSAAINQQLNALNFEAFSRIALISAINEGQVKFPDNSIPASAVKTNELAITGDQVTGGIIKNFGSTGIDDQSTECRVTILDNHTVFENNLLAAGLTVKGTTTVEGDLIIRGEIPVDSPAFVSIVTHSKDAVQKSIDKDLFDNYSNLIFDKIKANGLDLSKITIHGDEVISGNQIGSKITDSSLSTVGTLKELQVSGEALLSDTLYSTRTRVGINTIQPSQALSIWDEEIEIGVGKKQKDVGVFGTPRNQKLVLTSNNQNNIQLNTDGSVTIQKLNIGTMTFSSSDITPNYSADRGTVVFNSNPSLGGPLGWVSLGDARWANFGIID